MIMTIGEIKKFRKQIRKAIINNEDYQEIIRQLELTILYRITLDINKEVYYFTKYDCDEYKQKVESNYYISEYLKKLLDEYNISFTAFQSGELFYISSTDGKAFEVIEMI